jgi:hypothetical protein
VRPGILFLVLLSSPFLRAGDRPLEPVTVCEVLKNLAAYDGKVVAVVGRFSFRQTGRWIGEQKCETKPTAGDPEWANALWVAYDPAAAPKPPDVLAVDGVVLAQKLRAVKLGTALAHFRFGSSDYDRWAVAYGRVETRKDLPAPAPGGIRKNGFGYGGAAPAQLVCHGDAVVVLLNDEATTPASR